jgi:hydrogenase maturation protease
MSRAVYPLVAIGVGNVLLGDDAIGVRVIEALRTLAGSDPALLPAGTRLVDGGTLGLELLGIVSESRGLVLVDAVRLGGTPGRVRVLRGDAIACVGPGADGGAAGAVGELLAMARLMAWLPRSVTLVGVEVAELDVGTQLTPAVSGALPAAVEAVRDELDRMDGRLITGMQGGLATGRMAGARA